MECLRGPWGFQKAFATAEPRLPVELVMVRVKHTSQGNRLGAKEVECREHYDELLNAGVA